MAYTIQQFRQEAASKAATAGMTFKAGYVEQVNLILGQETSGKLLILLLPRTLNFQRDGYKTGRVTFFYFKEWLSTSAYDDFEMSSIIAEELNTYLKTVFVKTQFNFYVKDGADFVITDFGGMKDKDNMFSCSCTIDLFLKC